MKAIVFTRIQEVELLLSVARRHLEGCYDLDADQEEADEIQEVAQGLEEIRGTLSKLRESGLK